MSSRTGTDWHKDFGSCNLPFIFCPFPLQSKITEFKTKTLVDTISGLGFDVTKEHILLVVDELTEEIAR